ncbi:MAG: alpha/beta hydrolase family protein [Candidatus Latescibacteria bacterium]|nr:alpha/beta hydrolase family protein [Candidatus Latescibacterota bacterium]
MAEMHNPYEQPGEVINRWVSDRQRLLRNEAEDFLRGVVLDYEPRRDAYWKRDYASVEAFEKSVAANRQRWGEAVGVFEGDGTDLDPRLELWCKDEQFTAWWVSIGLLGGLRARGILAIPKGHKDPVPLVIAQHGISSSPERVFGLDDPSDIYKGYGRRLVAEGFAVIAPMNISGGAPRARLERLCKLLGKTLWGLEIYRTQRFLDYLETREEIDVGRTGMYGISLGGAYTMFNTPLDERIGAAVVCAWFNDRRHKMAVDDPRYSCFLSVNEEHIWIPGWLREFTDSDLASLICPRPLLVEQGKADGIAWWPMMLQEYEETCEHYRKLGLEERIEIDLHEGGHEIRMEKSLEFLKKWLQP